MVFPEIFALVVRIFLLDVLFRPFLIDMYQYRIISMWPNVQKRPNVTFYYCLSCAYQKTFFFWSKKNFFSRKIISI